MTGSSQRVEISRVTGDGENAAGDVVAVEEPLEIQLVAAGAAGAAAKSVAITMRTPGDDHDLALGFLYSEGIVASMQHIVAINHVGETDPVTGLQNRIRVEIDAKVDLQLDRLQRHFYTTSSCGICGKASLEALRVSGLHSLRNAQPLFSRQLLHAIPDTLRKRQPVFTETGGLHAAAVFGPDGEIKIVREDVGRHNATDKVIGALFSADRLPAHETGLLVSGRASFELLQKALVAGIPLLAAVGAPSSLAVQTAREFDMTLIGFLRNDKFNVYTGPNRISKGSANS